MGPPVAQRPRRRRASGAPRELRGLSRSAPPSCVEERDSPTEGAHRGAATAPADGVPQPPSTPASEQTWTRRSRRPGVEAALAVPSARGLRAASSSLKFLGRKGLTIYGGRGLLAPGGGLLLGLGADARGVCCPWFPGLRRGARRAASSGKFPGLVLRRRSRSSSLMSVSSAERMSASRSRTTPRTASAV